MAELQTLDTDEPPREEERQELDGSAKSKIASGMHFIGSSVETIRTVLISIVLIFLFLGFIYNLFASSEKDIPEDVFRRLFKFIEAQSSAPLISLQDPCLDNRNSSEP